MYRIMHRVSNRVGWDYRIKPKRKRKNRMVRLNEKSWRNERKGRDKLTKKQLWIMYSL